MALELQRNRSKWWYGRVIVNGRKIGKNLGVEVKGVIPNSLAEQGDAIFERSRAKAQAALEKLQLDLKKRSTAEELVQTIHEIRTGARIGSIPLAEAAPRWKSLPRRRPLSPRYVTQAEAWMKDFVAFLNTTHPAVREMADVQQSMARAYFAKVEARGVSGKTYNNTLIFLRSCFEALKGTAIRLMNSSTRSRDTAQPNAHAEMSRVRAVGATGNLSSSPRFLPAVHAWLFKDLRPSSRCEEFIRVCAYGRIEAPVRRAAGSRAASCLASAQAPLGNCQCEGRKGSRRTDGQGGKKIGESEKVVKVIAGSAKSLLQRKDLGKVRQELLPKPPKAEF